MKFQMMLYSIRKGKDRYKLMKFKKKFRKNKIYNYCRLKNIMPFQPNWLHYWNKIQVVWLIFLYYILLVGFKEVLYAWRIKINLYYNYRENRVGNFTNLWNLPINYLEMLNIICSRMKLEINYVKLFKNKEILYICLEVLFLKILGILRKIVCI